MPSFQSQVAPWMQACFGPTISANIQERCHRFIEEALELIQALGTTASEAHQIVDYVYSRPKGKTDQEIGGVMVTLAALCLAADEDMDQAGATELDRVWLKIDQIRAKQASKPKHSPLAEAATDTVKTDADYINSVLCPNGGNWIHDLAECLRNGRVQGNSP